MSASLHTLPFLRTERPKRALSLLEVSTLAVAPNQPELKRIFHNHQKLVGGWATPLKNMSHVTWDDEIPYYSQYFWENKIHGNQTTKQWLTMTDLPPFLAVIHRDVCPEAKSGASAMLLKYRHLKCWNAISPKIDLK